jgi:GNAT superfamily N-acetyltransferase
VRPRSDFIAANTTNTFFSGYIQLISRRENSGTIMANSADITVKPMTYADMDIISRIGSEAMANDRHTQLKKLGDTPYAQDQPSNDGFRETLQNKRYVFVTAVNKEGEVVGGSSFYFRGFPQEHIPYTDPNTAEEKPKQMQAPELNEELEAKVPEPISEEQKRANDMIDRLEEMEGEDMERWQNILMPPGSKCIIVTGLSVSPKHQRKGVGSKLLKWGTDKADEHGVFMWVHSSEASYKVYSNGGFEVVGVLDIDLDAWAPAPPPGEGEGARWGRYVCRYMKRLPKKAWPEDQWRDQVS